MTTTTTTLTEDDLYRTSSQFRLWSFSPEGLAAVRQKTHELAVERARRYLGRNGQAQDGDVAAVCLTAEEELQLIQRYCDQLRTTSDHFKWPVQVKATAVQYLRRFYLSNSVLTYPPKEIYKTILFLACKTEATHMPLSEYARRIKADPDSILAPEFKIMQALRFTLDVKQPYRGLKGVWMELTNMAHGMVGEVVGVEGQGAKALQEGLMNLQTPGEDAKTPWKAPAGRVEAKHAANRVDAAYHAARDVLNGSALLSDAYFLYTPSQILLAGLHIADSALLDFYLDTKLPATSPDRPKILATIHACAELLMAASTHGVISKEERERLEEKLEGCRDPATRDLVKVHAAAKMGDGDDEEKARKRREAREKSLREGEELFGPNLANGKG